MQSFLDFIMGHGKKVALVLILLLALFFRFYRLAELPPALDVDEAINGIKAQGVLQTGDIAFFYGKHRLDLPEKYQSAQSKEEALKQVANPNNPGSTPFEQYQAEEFAHEGLYTNLLALSIYIFGSTPWALRALSAILGFITVFGFFLLAGEFVQWANTTEDDPSNNSQALSSTGSYFDMPHSPTTMAYLCAFLLATSSWHSLMSRIAFMHILTPAITVFAFYFLFKAFTHRGRPLDFILSGALTGLSFHTFLSNRVLPFVVIAFMALAFAHELRARSYRDKSSDVAGGMDLTSSIILFWVMWLIVASPILYYFYYHPSDFFHRAGQLSILNNKDWVFTVFKNFLITLGQFSLSGDTVLKHNLPGTSQLLRPVGVAFIFGLVVAMAGSVRFIKGLFRVRAQGREGSGPASLFLIIWLVATLAPAFLSSGPHPHAARSLNAILPALMLAGIGALKLYEYFVLSFGHLIGKGRLTALVLILLMAVTVGQYKKYFIDWGGNDKLGPFFDQSRYAIANFVKDSPLGYKKFIIVNHSPASIQFITNTYANETARANNIIYLWPNRRTKIDYQAQRPYIFIALKYDERLFNQIKARVPGRYVQEQYFSYIIYE